MAIPETMGYQTEYQGLEQFSNHMHRWQFFKGDLYIVRCVMCGQVFPAAPELMRQYHVYTHRLDKYEALSQALQEAREAMTTAIAQWGGEAGKDALSRALRADGVSDPEARAAE